MTNQSSESESRVFGPTWEQARGQSWSIADDTAPGYVAEYRAMASVSPTPEITTKEPVTPTPQAERAVGYICVNPMVAE